jgi:hypothetical protein
MPPVVEIAVEVGIPAFAPVNVVAHNPVPSAPVIAVAMSVAEGIE